jgi:hypothetical protein
MPLSKTRSIGWPNSIRSIIGNNAERLTTRTFLGLLVPIGLVGSYLYMWSNPSAMMRWLAPISPAAREGWVIKTPADIELMISQAQKNQTAPSDPNLENTIRILAQTLQSKRVQLVVTDHVTPGAGGEWDTTRGELRLRPSTIAMGIPVLANALAHESAHVAQSCRAGGIGKKSIALGIQVDPANTYQRELDLPLYRGPIFDKATELEAFTVGAIPPWAVSLIKDYCKS